MQDASARVLYFVTNRFFYVYVEPDSTTSDDSGFVTGIELFVDGARAQI